MQSKNCLNCLIVVSISGIRLQFFSMHVLITKHSQKLHELAGWNEIFELFWHRDRASSTVIHDLEAICSESIRILIVVSAIFGFDIFLADRQQVHAHTKSHLLRKAFTTPPELLLDVNKFVHLKRPIYGLPDAGEYWNDTLVRHLQYHC